jgi:signal transduction histidine kinase
LTAVAAPQQPSKSEITRVLHGEEAVTDSILKFIADAKQGWDTYIDKTGLSIALTVEPIRKALADAKNNKGLKIKAITEITKDNLKCCKEYMHIVTELRHLDGIRGNFATSESEYIATATLQETTQRLQIIYSNVKNIVEQHQYLFENLWTRAIPAEEKIKEIENQIILGKTEVIRNPKDIQELFIDMVKSAKQEVLLVLPTINAFYREERIGLIELLKQAAGRKDNKVNVKILTPRNDIIEKKTETINTPNIDIASYEEEEELQLEAEKITITTVTIVIVDRKESLVIEKTDDSKQNFIEAVGIATYSNSNPTVLSYVSIFRSLWSQIKLYERVKQANVQLKRHDKMQMEFINMASHEIKTPTQAILGYAEILHKHPERRDEILNAISRNATRLQRLTNDILDVSRIESHTLKLTKEQFNINDLILDIVQDYRNQIEKEKDKYNLALVCKYHHKNHDDDNDVFSSLIVEADKERIIQVISNLLNNAIKFTKDGQITINVMKYTDEEYNVKKDSSQKREEQVMVSIKDTGTGISFDMLPRLFTKFATKSGSGGTGLGLFISKSIIEAHGGRIWAQNSTDGEKGATFYFTIPLSRQTNKNIN